ncbi:MAG: cbb3-type cytochrome c oxidase subunit I [Bacteroidetes bacterium]|nr:cbb3-type cytochrome c oxidase subunit I [Bacteroidota bacterium]
MQSETLYSIPQFHNQRPTQHVFGSIGAVLAIAGIIGLLFPEFTLNITFHESYFSILHAHIALGLCIICIIYAAIYSLFFRWRKPLHLRMGLVHCILTVAPVIVAWILMLFQESNVPTRYHTNAAIQDLYSERYSFSNLIITIPCFLFILGQVIFLMNLCLALMPHKEDED